MDKKTQKMFTDFIHSIDEELTVSFNENEGYCFDTLENRVNLALSQTDDCGFIRHLKETHKCPFAERINLILWSILHEIGHYETENEVEEYDEDYEMRIWLMLTDETYRHNTAIQDRYFNLPAEYAATEWAKEWVENNYDKAVNFSNILNLL